VECAVAVAAEDNEVFFAVFSCLAPADHVMNLQLFAPATLLAMPTIPLQDFHFELVIDSGIKP
jgi:hypothetical protein